MIDRYLLRYLLAVVDKGNFSRAAAHCGVSQPTLSVGIAKLESEIGKTLFLRSSRRVELTGAGARLVERARRIEREFTLAEQETRATRFQTTVRLGVISTLPSSWLEAAVGRLAAEAPDERVEIVEASERALLSHLDRGRLDVILTAIRPDRVRFANILFEEPYRLVLPIDHRLAGQEVVEAEELSDSPMIARRHCEGLAETSRFFTSRGVRPFISARTTSDDQALAYVRGGHGLTVMPLAFARCAPVMAELAGFKLTRQIGLMHHQRPGDHADGCALRVIADSIRASRSSLSQRPIFPDEPVDRVRAVIAPRSS
ncbi:LysR family transcriptional regulator [Sphingomonas sp. AP4-R1]|uniref:LysR family transcriptional regulator n=1 Tax=Sphingomonas sp. AP4-R1 TaxID=2735134 RepID=UPI00149329AD|nr:LysR family transcriptional regulator [Sphingomonas sp. AP4-R1]QJU59923.1 LysR family transcriptional regulator [Sphingomonas sp. AP4-R1]